MDLEKFSFKDSKFYKECMAHYLFCHPLILQFSWLVFPSILLAKRWKLHKLLKLISSFNLALRLYIWPRLLSASQKGCMLMRKNVNNEVSKDSPIALPLFQSISITYVCMHTSVSLIALCWALTLPLPGTSCGNVTLESAGSSPSLSEP